MLSPDYFHYLKVFPTTLRTTLMDLLTRPEEFVLLAVWRLQDEAYSVPIRRKLSEITGRKWSLGSVYSPLERLSKRGYIDSHFTDPTPERGGRPKRIYALTRKGRQALLEVYAVGRDMWQGVTLPALEAGRP